MFERRHLQRKPVDMLFNRFLGGYPYLCRALELSTSAVLVETFAEPTATSDRFSLEVRFPGDKASLWLWARRLRREGQREALEFVSLSPPAQHRIERFLNADR